MWDEYLIDWTLHIRAVHINSGLSDQALLLTLVGACNTGCPRKNVTLFWRAVAPINFDLGSKVGGALESSGSQL